MKLLMLTVDWSPIEGGIATLCEGIAGGLARRGHELCVLAPARPAATPVAPGDPVRVVRWPGYDLGWARSLPFAVAAARQLPGTDAILAMNPAYGGTVATMSRRPYLAWAYGYELLKARATPLAPLYRRVFGHSRAAIAISQHTRDLLLGLGVPAARIRIVPPGVDAPGPLAADPAVVRAEHGLGQGPLILTVGRLIPRKGHLRLLEALPAVFAAHPAARWVVVGRGPLEAAIWTRARELGLCDKVHLTGYLAPASLDALYTTASVFALIPQPEKDDVEGFGIVYLEAGARGLATLAASCGGVADAVADGVNGLLVEPTSSPAIAQALLTLLGDDQLRLRLGEGGHEVARAHSWDRAASAVEDLIASPQAAR